MVVLGALTLWPLFHIAIVKAHDMNSWKMAGWGMYAQPYRRLSSIEVVAVARGGATTRLDRERLPAEVRGELDRFLDDRWAFGELAAPSKERFRALLPRLQSAYPAYAGFRLEFRERRLDSGTGFYDRKALTVELSE